MREYGIAFRSMAMGMALLTGIVSMPWHAANAAMVPTEQVIVSAQADADRAKLGRFMERDDVRQQMQRLGVDPEEAAARVAAMSDREVQQIAGHVEDVPAGQDALGAIVGAALIVFIILLITDIAGLTNVFPFTRGAARR